MQYFKILNMNREPFSNSPEPEFFYKSAQYQDCLQQLELAIRLRRGLNVVIGHVGTGKTTLCRELLLRFTEMEDDRNEFETHLFLDPSFSTVREFLAAVAVSFGYSLGDGETEWQIKERIKNHLFLRGVEEKKIVVMAIDEGQKLPAHCREALREFLNYETNENKLLQIVIFAQEEFREIMKEHDNFADRVNRCFFLKPLSFPETRAMIQFRIARAGRTSGAPLFTVPGCWAVYRATEGYPRRIVNLCHQAILALIIQNKDRVGFPLVRSVIHRVDPRGPGRRRWATVAMTATAFLFLAGYLFFVLKPLNMINQVASLDKPAATAGEAAGGALTLSVGDEGGPAGAPALSGSGGGGMGATPLPASNAAIAEAAADQAGTPAVIPAAGTVFSTATPSSGRAGQDGAAVTPPAAVSPGHRAVTPRQEAAAASSGRDAASPRQDAAVAPGTFPPAAFHGAGGKKAAPEREAPRSLGKLKMKEGNTVHRLLLAVYGKRGPSRMAALAKTNPGIPNMNLVRPGQGIEFPALPAPQESWPGVEKRVFVGSGGDLEEAYGLYRRYGEDTMILPFWNPQEGMVFALTLKKTFATEAEARRAIRELPPEQAERAKVMARPGADTVLFAN